jgi:hypothetical protein
VRGTGTLTGESHDAVDTAITEELKLTGLKGR